MRRMKLSNLFQIIGGGTPNTSIVEYWGGEIPWISVADMGDDYRYIDKTSKTITELGLKESSTKILEKGDIIISARGTVGVINQIRNPMAFNQTCYGLRAKTDKVDVNYLYYLLKRHVPHLQQVVHGAVFNTITRESFDLVDVDLPSLETQKEIAHILGTLDEKIELNRRMNQTLEEMAQTFYKHWFIDFEFPNEEGKPYKSSGGEMVDSELGPIPTVMELHKLSDIIEINPYRPLQKGIKAPYLDMSNVPTDGSYPYITTFREYTSGTKFMNGDTLVAKITPCLENGKTAFISCLQDNQVAWGSSEFYVLRPKGKIPPVFTYLLARNKDFRYYLINTMTGSSGRQRVPYDGMSSYLMRLHRIDSDVFSHFHDRVSIMFKSIQEYMMQIEILSEVKKSMINRLINSNPIKETSLRQRKF